MELTVPQEHVAQMEIRVNPVRVDRPQPWVRQLGDSLGNSTISILQTGRQSAVLPQPFHRTADERIGIERSTRGFRRGRPNVVSSGHQHAKTLGQIRAQLVGRPPTPTIGQTVVDPVDRLERASVGKWTNRADRDNRLFELPQKTVLLEDLRLPPTPGSLELGNQATPVDQLDFIDPVLEGVERIAEIVALDAPGLDRRKVPFGSQREKNVCDEGVGHCGHQLQTPQR